MCACWCVCVRAGVKTSSPITVSDHSALADDFLNPIGLPRCLLSIAFVDASLTHSCLLSPPFLISPAISFHFNNFPLFSPFLHFIVLKGRSVNRSPPTRGFGTAACARTRTRQKHLSAWCVMSGRGHQRGKAMDIHYLWCLCISGSQRGGLWWLWDCPPQQNEGQFNLTTTPLPLSN